MMVVRPSSATRWINIAIIGLHQHGKSTLAGFLLHALHEIPATIMGEAEQAASTRGDPGRKFAFLLDRKAHERKIKGTQETSWWGLERKGRSYLLIDSPGQHSRVLHLIGALSDADAALLVVDTASLTDSKLTQAEQDQQALGQIYTQLSLARFYGISQLIIALHKMDTVDFSVLMYHQAKAHLERMLEELAWDGSKVCFVPTAVKVTEKTTEYNITRPNPSLSECSPGTTLIDALEQLQPRPASLHASFCMQVNAVSQGRRVRIPGFHLVISGKVLAGTVKVRDELLIQPSGTRCQVQSIKSIDSSKSIDRTSRWPEQSQATAGEIVRLDCTIIDPGDSDEPKVGIGEIVETGTSTSLIGRRLRAALVSLSGRTLDDQFTRYLSGTFVIGHFHTRFRIDAFSLDGGITWQHRPGKQQKQLRTSEVPNPRQGAPILVELTLAKEAPLETFTENTHFGRFLLLDSHLSLLCGGHITEIL